MNGNEGRTADAMTFLGMKAITTPFLGKAQRIKFPTNTAASPEVVQEFNDWLLQMFGEDDQVLVLDMKALRVLEFDSFHRSVNFGPDSDLRLAVSPAGFKTLSLMHDKSSPVFKLGDVC